MKLTPEQKEHLKIVHRANMRIEETWSLFTMYLSQDKGPVAALELAREAVSIWAEWMDDNEIEPPDIERPDFGEQMKEAIAAMSKNLPQAIFGVPKLAAGSGPTVGQFDIGIQIGPQGAQLVDAEFIPEFPAHPEAPEPSSQEESQQSKNS